MEKPEYLLRREMTSKDDKERVKEGQVDFSNRSKDIVEKEKEAFGGSEYGKH